MHFHPNIIKLDHLKLWKLKKSNEVWILSGHLAEYRYTFMYQSTRSSDLPKSFGGDSLGSFCLIFMVITILFTEAVTSPLKLQIGFSVRYAPLSLFETFIQFAMPRHVCTERLREHLL